MSKSLSIIIPMYNAENYIERCIESILNQGLNPADFEVLIMNDGSTDSSPERVQNFTDSGAPVFLHSHSNVGPDASRNRGFTLATGKYIYLMDADDYLAYNCLNTILGRALEDDLQIVAFQAVFTDKDAWFEAEKNPADIAKPAFITGKEYIKHNRNTRFESWWFITKRSFLDQTGVRFDAHNACSDTFYMLEHFLRAERMAYYPLEIYRYYDAPTSLTRDKKDKTYIARMLRDFNKTSIGFSEILLQLKNESGTVDPQLWDNLTHRRDYFVFYYISLMIRGDYSKKEISDQLELLKQKEAYPIKNFIGPEYNSKKWKAFNFIFNRKSLLLNLAPVYKKMQS